MGGGALTDKLAQVVTVFTGDKFPVEYFRAWRRMVPEVRFVTDNLEHATERDAIIGRPHQNWWDKLQVFLGWLDHFRPCLYMDLDTLVLGDLTTLRSQSGFRMLLHDGWQPASGIMAIPREGVRPIARDWIIRSHEIMSTYQGDQDYLTQHCGAFLPEDGLYSYKLHCQGKDSRDSRDSRDSHPPDARVVYFHGRPRPHEVRTGWVRDLWHDLTR